MKIASITILISLLLPTFTVAQDDPVIIALPETGFVESAEAQNLTVAGTIERGFWKNPISKHGGTIIVYASAGGKQVLKQLENAEPILNPKGRVTGYTFNISIDVQELRGETVLPLKVSIESRNHNGELEDYDEVWGTIEPVIQTALAIELASNTPPSAILEKGNTDNNFTAITFSAENSSEHIQINQIVLTRYGGVDDDILKVKVFDGSTMIGWANFSNGKATIDNVLWFIPKGLNKTFMIKADISQNANGYSTEEGITIGIASASEIKTIGAESASAVTIGGQFPVVGNPMGIQ